MSIPNRVFFGIRHQGQLSDSDIWMNQHGDLGSRVLCRIFESAEEAQAFLDSRRLRPGFRPHLSVQPLSAADIRAMSNEAAECLACARRHEDQAGDVLMWRARFDFLSTLTPLEA